MYQCTGHSSDSLRSSDPFPFSFFISDFCRGEIVSGPQTAFRLTRAHGEVSVICNLIARLSPLQKSDTKKEKGKGSEDLRLGGKGSEQCSAVCYHNTYW